MIMIITMMITRRPGLRPRRRHAAQHQPPDHEQEPDHGAGPIKISKTHV